MKTSHKYILLLIYASDSLILRGKCQTHHGCKHEMLQHFGIQARLPPLHCHLLLRPVLLLSASLLPMSCMYSLSLGMMMDLYWNSLFSLHLIQIDIMFDPRKHLARNTYDKVLETLWTEFKGFPTAFYKFAMDRYCKISYHIHLPSSFRASEESTALAKNFKQPTPHSLTREDLMNFKLRDEFETLRSNCPLQYHVVCGALELGEDQLQVTPEKLQLTFISSSGTKLLLAWWDSVRGVTARSHCTADGSNPLLGPSQEQGSSRHSQWDFWSGEPPQSGHIQVGEQLGQNGVPPKLLKCSRQVHRRSQPGIRSSYVFPGKKVGSSSFRMWMDGGRRWKQSGMRSQIA